jgi:hypothetical protein
MTNNFTASIQKLKMGGKRLKRQKYLLQNVKGRKWNFAIKRDNNSKTTIKQ